MTTSSRTNQKLLEENSFATEMGLPLKMIEGIRVGGYIHDIGKLSIPADKAFSIKEKLSPRGCVALAMFIVMLVFTSTTSLKAQTQSHTDNSDVQTVELAKKLENPLAIHIILPIQTNLDFGIGSMRATRVTAAIKPSIPFSLNDEYALLVRTTIPFIYAEGTVRGALDTTGLGDILQSFYLIPATISKSGWIWGLGPIFNYPTTTDAALGRKKFSLGPTAAILRRAGPWTYGVVAAHLWSAENNDQRGDVNASTVQPFAAYTTRIATSFSVNTISRFDWRANQWVVPLNASVSQILKIGKQPVQFLLGGTYYAEKPVGGPDWGLNFTVTFLFSK